ncbi:MAG: hypothetical protein C0391_09285 [Anaerolinea sp.]|nr:hypothetical protein [Anaerolinea sp.]
MRGLQTKKVGALGTHPTADRPAAQISLGGGFYDRSNLLHALRLLRHWVANDTTSGKDCFGRN